jgi:uncharacterized MAPEG superfamily protein
MYGEVPLELKLLGASIVVGFFQLMWAAGAARAQQDMKWAAGPRDTPMPIKGMAARLERAFWNFMETFPFFAAAILACAAADKLGSPLTVWGSWAYLVGRAAYVPLYASGVRGVRTLIWGVAIAGLAAVVVALFR